MHGGPTPKGIASAAFKHGRYSKHLPAPLAARHEADMAQLQEIKRLDEEIVYIHGQICRRLESLHTGERGSFVWDDLQQLLIDAQAENLDAATIIERLTPIAAKGKETAQAEREIIALIHDKAKVSAIEARRAQDAGEVITKDDTKTIVLQIVNCVRDHVSDPIQLRAISNDLAIVLNGKRQTPAKALPAPPTPPS